MGTTIDLNAVLAHVQSKGVTLNKAQKAELANLFYKADKIERADGELSEKEFNYFVSHANKDWNVGNAAEVTNSATNRDNLKQRIKKIDEQIEALQKVRRGSPEDGATFIGYVVASATGVITVPAGAILANGTATALGGAACMLAGFGAAAACGAVAAGLVYAGYKLFTSDETQNDDKKIELQNKQIVKQIKKLEQERENLKAILEH